MASHRCVCPCHRSSILTAFHGAEILDPIEAVTSCLTCINIHVPVLLIRTIWGTPAPEPSPYKDEPPAPAMFTSDEDE